LELPSTRPQAHIRPWWKFRTRRPLKPFDFVTEIEHLEYCRHCDMDVSVEISQAMRKKLYVYRKNCLRCGQVMAFGIAKTDLNKPGDLNPAVNDFIQETTRDRR